MKTPQWSETNPTTKLRDVVFRNGIYYGTVEESFLPEQYKAHVLYPFYSYTIHDYKDHFFIVTGNTVHNKRYHYVSKDKLIL